MVPISLTLTCVRVSRRNAQSCPWLRRWRRRRPSLRYGLTASQPHSLKASPPTNKRTFQFPRRKSVFREILQVLQKKLSEKQLCVPVCVQRHAVQTNHMRGDRALVQKRRRKQQECVAFADQLTALLSVAAQEPTHPLRSQRTRSATCSGDRWTDGVDGTRRRCSYLARVLSVSRGRAGRQLQRGREPHR